MRILITGAARGLGWHMVKEAAERGHTVFAGVREREVGNNLEALSLKHPRLVIPMKLNVTDKEEINRAGEYIREKYNALDGLINNAAVQLGREETIDSLDLDLVRQSMETNLLGSMEVVQGLLPLLYQGEKAGIINISSEAGTIINAFPTNYPYAISKTAINMFTERLRAHMQPKGIRVYAIHPGWMRTGMGGEDAPADPGVVAQGILNILEGKTNITSKISFIDATGRPMPL